MCIVLKLNLQLTVVLTLAQTVSSEGMAHGFEEPVDTKDHASAWASCSSRQISSSCYSICRLRSWKSVELLGAASEAGEQGGSRNGSGVWHRYGRRSTVWQRLARKEVINKTRGKGWAL